MFQNMPMSEILQAWSSQTDSAYIHYHENNSQNIARSELQKIHHKAMNRAKTQALLRMDTQLLENGKTKLGIIRESLKDTNTVVDYLKTILTESNIKSAATAVSTMVYHLSSSKYSASVTSSEVIEFVNQMYEYLNGKNNIWGQLETLKSNQNLMPIDAAQLASITQLKSLLEESATLNVGKVRNLLIDIFTEQGLHQFINKALNNINDSVLNLIQNTIHTGKATTAHVRNIKPDAEITFAVPNPDGLTVQQMGISIKSAYSGKAKVLTTTLRSTLLWVNQLQDISTMNYLSLMRPKEIGRWSILSNIDRSLTGSMESVLGMNGVLDYASMLVEFTKDGLQVYSYAQILDTLYNVLSTSTDITDLVPYGFSIGGAEAYLRKGYEVNANASVIEQIQARARATNKWLQQVHVIYFNVAKYFNKINNG